MLVLGRKEGESIKISKDIIITIISNRDGYVRVGIQAPTHIKVLRSELEKNNGLIASSRF